MEGVRSPSGGVVTQTVGTPSMSRGGSGRWCRVDVALERCREASRSLDAVHDEDAFIQEPDTGSGQAEPQSSARCRKAAIWPRVTGSFGQNFVAVHPAVMPALRRRLMSTSWVLPWSSVK